MSNTSKKSKKLRWILLFCVFGLIVLVVCLAVFRRGPWIVPAAEKARVNPLSPTEANLTAAKELYSNKCADCHGAKGKGDGDEAMMYDPTPSDLTNPSEMNKLTDGEIFYQITEGRKPMPSFRKKLTEEQRWQLVLLVRSFTVPQAAVPANAQPAPPPKLD
jgi:mono/diheme cytochrome c family protein